LCEASGDARGAIVARGNAGRALIQLQRFEEAEQALAQAAKMACALSDYPMWVHTLGRLGTLQLQRHRHVEARKTLAQAVGLAAALDDPGVEAPLLQRLAAAVAADKSEGVDEGRGQFVGGNISRRAEGAAAAGTGCSNLADADRGADIFLRTSRAAVAGAAAGAASPVARSVAADAVSVDPSSACALSVRRVSHGQGAFRCCPGALETFPSTCPKQATANDGNGSRLAARTTGLDSAGEAGAGAGEAMAGKSVAVQRAGDAEAGVSGGCNVGECRVAELGAAAESGEEAEAGAGSTADRTGQPVAASQHAAEQSGTVGATAGRSAAGSCESEVGSHGEMSGSEPGGQATSCSDFNKQKAHLAAVHLLRRAVRLTSEGDAAGLKLQVRRAACPPVIVKRHCHGLGERTCASHPV
jgi:tetratricopeptide (TPR) repeat protein